MSNGKLLKLLVLLECFRIKYSKNDSAINQAFDTIMRELMNSAPEWNIDEIHKTIGDFAELMLL